MGFVVNYKYLSFWVLGILLSSTCVNLAALANKKFVILIASYNNEKWCRWNLRSVLNQKYGDFRIIYIDDCSRDNTAQIVQHLMETEDPMHKITFIRNVERQGAPLVNHYNAIHELCADDEIIVIVDGDDALAHKEVLGYLNKIYNSGDIWLTYGQYRELISGYIGFSKMPSDTIIKNNAFRKWELMPSHLRTFYAWLFKRIDKKDLTTDDGKFFTMAGDLAAMTPMIEMACHHFKFIPEVLYIYNDVNPISEHRVSRELQAKVDRQIRGLRPYLAL